jgi:ABC-type amino acid transport substrate-binding protein
MLNEKKIILIILSWILSICSCMKNELPLYFSDSEKQWLVQHNYHISIAPECQYPPFIYQNNKNIITGISVEYLKNIADKLPVTFKMTPCKNLASNLTLIKNGEVDVITSLKKTPERSQYLLFTEPYISVPVVIMVNRNLYRDFTHTDLNTMTISLGKDYGIHEFVRKEHPHYKIVPVKNDRLGLQKLAFMEVDAHLVDSATATFIVDETGISNIRVAGEFDYVYDLSLACSNNEPELHSILMKGLNSISPRRRAQIKQKWIRSHEFSLFSSRRFWIIVSIFFGAIIVIALWNTSLRIRVKKRTAELSRYRDHLEELVEARTAELERSNKDLKKALTQVKSLSGLLPICASCKKIRDDKGYWEHIELYVRNHSEADFSHSLCPDCAKKLYGKKTE